MRHIDFLSSCAARLAAWLFFAVGLMVTWEVIMRKGFNAPTTWTDEISRLLLVWAVYLGAAEVLKRRKLIMVELFDRFVSERTARCLDLLALCVILLFSAVAAFYGGVEVYDSIELGRRTSSILALPKWLPQGCVPVGFTLLALQALAETVKSVRGEVRS